MTYYLGIDPGPSTGIAILSIGDLESSWEIFQCLGESSYWLIDKIYADYKPRVVAVEEFVPSNRAGGVGKDAQLTRSVANYAVNRAKDAGLYVVERRARDVKLWASDKRMKKSDFPTGAKFKDARSAGWHALFASVKDGKERDPLA